MTGKKRRRLAFSLPVELKGVCRCLHSSKKGRTLRDVYKQDVKMIPSVQTFQALKL